MSLLCGILTVVITWVSLQADGTYDHWFLSVRKRQSSGETGDEMGFYSPAAGCSELRTGILSQSLGWTS